MALDILVTYDDSGWRVPDVMEQILLLTPVDTPLFSGLPKKVANDIVHFWQEKSITTYAENAVVEGAAFGSATSTIPTRPGNVTQIFEKEYDVSSTQQWAKHYGVSNMVNAQRNDRMMEIATDVEHAILQGSIATGTGTAARHMAGFLNFITTNYTDMASSGKLTESLFQDLLQDIWTSGGKPDEVYMGAQLKRVVNEYTMGTTRYIDARDRRFVTGVNVYESSFGVQKLFMHRDMPSTLGTNASCLFLTRRMNAVAIGEAIHDLPESEVAQTKHGKFGVIRGELTLEVTTESHQGLIAGLDTNFPA